MNYVMTSKNIGSGTGHKGEHILVHFVGCVTKCCVSFFREMQVLNSSARS